MAKLSACLTRLRKKANRLRIKTTSSKREVHPDAEISTTAEAATQTDEYSNSWKFEGENLEDYVNGVSRMFPLQVGGRTVAAIAPTYDLSQRLQAAIRDNRRIRDAEEDFDELERVLVEELEEIRVEGESLLADNRTGPQERRLDELEQRDKEIVRELDGQYEEVMDMWPDLRGKVCALFDLLDGVFVRSELLPPRSRMSETDHGEHLPSETRKEHEFQSGKRTSCSSGARTVIRSTEDSLHLHGEAQQSSNLRSSRRVNETKADGEERSVDVRDYRDLASAVAAELRSNPKLFGRLREAITDNRHMKQFESRVCELYEAEEEILASIQKKEASFIVRSYIPDAEEDAVELRELKQEHKLIHKELERFQTDAEVKWIMMRDWLRFVLDALDEVFVRSGDLSPSEGLRDIDNGKPITVQFDERMDKATGYWLSADHDMARPISEVSPRRGRSSTEKPRLARKSKTHHDLRAEVQRLENEIDERMEFERRLVQNYVTARRDVEEAKRQFDQKEVRRDREEDRFRARHAAGADVGSPTEFDLKLLLDKQRLTRNLIEAEEDFEVAKAKTVEEEVHLSDDERSSGFQDHESDGYRASRELEAAGSIDREEFLRWIEQIPGQAAPEGTVDGERREVAPDERPDMDEWDARSVEVSDSISVVAVGSYRRRIDQWRKNGYAHLEDQ